MEGCCRQRLDEYGFYSGNNKEEDAEINRQKGLLHTLLREQCLGHRKVQQNKFEHLHRCSQCGQLWVDWEETPEGSKGVEFLRKISADEAKRLFPDAKF